MICRWFAMLPMLALAGLPLALTASADDARLPPAAEAAGLADALAVIPDLQLDIRYAGAANFVGVAVYPASRCWLQRDVLARLARVQADFRAQGLALMVYDCYRPFSVQERFWALVPDERYVGRPLRGPDGQPLQGSRHNRGAAVDVGLVELASGAVLPMPTGYDDFSERAHRDYRGDLPAQVLANRERLARAMQAHGFVGLPTEWWHFDAEDWPRYPLLDIPLR